MDNGDFWIADFSQGHALTLTEPHPVGILTVAELHYAISHEDNIRIHDFTAMAGGGFTNWFGYYLEGSYSLSPAERDSDSYYFSVGTLFSAQFGVVEGIINPHFHLMRDDFTTETIRSSGLNGFINLRLGIMVPYLLMGYDRNPHSENQWLLGFGSGFFVLEKWEFFLQYNVSYPRQESNATTPSHSATFGINYQLAQFMQIATEMTMNIAPHLPDNSYKSLDYNVSLGAIFSI